MKRRTLLTAGALGCSGLGLSGLPGMIGRAFAQVDPEDNGRDRAQELQAVSTAYREAQRRGQPLLVIVVPEDGGARWERAHAFGEVLNYGGDSVYVDLALARVVCSSMRTLRQLVPQAPADEPWLVVVDPSQHPATLQAHDLQVPEWPNHWANERPWEEFERQTQLVIDQRIAILRASLHAALAADDAALAARAAVAERALGAALSARVTAAAAAGRRDAALFVQAPAIALRAARSERARGVVEEALIAQARTELHESPVPGSRWARGGGCGVHIEGVPDDQQMMVACGMGHVPERSGRFLYWYTED